MKILTMLFVAALVTTGCASSSKTYTADGKEFDSNYDKGFTFDLTVGAGSVIQGWDEGLIGVQAGGRYQFDIPSDLAYGPDDYNGIPGGSNLTFVVDVMDVIPATPAPDASTTTVAGATTTVGAVTTTS